VQFGRAADGRLRAARYGLRVRDLGARRIATLKSDARVADGVYEREEWEVAIGDDDRPETWPPGDVRDRTLALLGDRALQPILRIDTLRRHIFAERVGARVAELSLDEGTIRAGGSEARLRELFGDSIADLQVRKRHWVFRYRSPEAYLDYWRHWYGPTLKTFEAVGPDGEAALRQDLLDLVARFNVAVDGTMAVPSEYLEAVIRLR